MEPAETARVRTAEQEASAAIVGAEGVEFLEGHHDGDARPTASTCAVTWPAPSAGTDPTW